MIAECKTTSGPDPNKPCKFPFEYQGELHHKCTLQNDTNYWCATDTSNSSNIDARHGYCELKCPRENGTVANVIYNISRFSVAKIFLDNIYHVRNTYSSLTVQFLGCWFDARGDRAIDEYHGNLDVKGCYERSKELNYSVFAIEKKDSDCYSSSEAEETYKKYGAHDLHGRPRCINGVNEVYKIEKEGSLEINHFMSLHRNSIYLNAHNRYIFLLL